MIAMRYFVDLPQRWNVLHSVMNCNVPPNHNTRYQVDECTDRNILNFIVYTLEVIKREFVMEKMFLLQDFAFQTGFNIANMQHFDYA